MKSNIHRLAYSGVVVLAGAFSASAQAADCDWLGGSGNWTDSNWGSCLGSFPSSSDIASIATGTVTLDQAITLQQLNLSAGTIDGNNNLSISGQANITGGNSTMRGTGTTRADGGLALDGTFMDIQNARTLVNGAGQTANWTAGGLRLLNAGSTLQNEATGSFNITGDSRTLTGAGLFDNQGSLVVNLSDSLQELAVDTVLDNDGSLDVQSGVLVLGSGGNHSGGTFTGGANGVLEFSGGTHTLDATSSITATNVRFDNQISGAGNTLIGGTYNVANTVIEGNTASFNSAAQTGTLTQTGGSLGGTDTLTVTGLTSWTGGGGVMNSTGTTRADGGLALDGTFMDIQNARTLVNGAGQTANWTAGGLRLLNAGSTLQNEATGSFNITGDSRTLTGAGLFDNQGSLVVNLSDSLQELAVDTVLDNDGSLDVQSGVLVLGSGGNHSGGTFTGGANGVLEFSGGTHTLDATSSITATNVRFDNQISGAGNTLIGGTYNVANTVIEGNTASFNSAAQTGTLTQTGGSLGGTDTLTVTGLTSWTGGGVMSGTGTTRADGGLALDGTFMDIQNARTLVNGAGQTANWTAGGLRLLNAGTTLQNESTATFNITGDSRTLTGAGLFDNQGSLVVNLSDSLQELAVDTVLDNDGSLDVQSGVLVLGSGGNHNGGTFTGGANGVLEFSGGTHTLDATSSITATNVRFDNQISGAGNTLIGGTYNVANTVIEGNTASFNSAAQTGTLTQTGGSLGGTDTLTVTGLTSWTGGGVMSGTGTTRADGGLALDGTFMDIQNARTLVNGAGQTANWTAGGLRLLNAGTTLQNESTATFNITGDSRTLTGAGLFDNQGSLVVNLSDSLQELAVDTVLDNDGSLDVQSGVLVLGSGGNHNGGTFTGGANGVLEFSGGTHTLDATSSITATNVRFDNQISGAGNTLIGGTYNVANTVIEGNTASFNSAAQTGTLTQTGGTLGGTDTLTVTGLTSWTGGGGVMSGTGTTRADGGLALDGTFMDIQNTRTLVNGAGQTANWTAGGLRLLNAGTTLQNESTATFNITGDSRTLTGSGTFENTGNLNVTLAGSTETLTVSSGLVNDGSVTVQGGTLALSTDASGSGQWQADGGKIQLNTNADVTTSGDIGVSNGGELEISNAASLTGSNLTMDPTATLDTIGNATLSLSGDLSFAMTDEALWSFDATSTLEMTGGVGAAVGDWGAWGSLEIGGIDIGTDPFNHVGDPMGFSNNFDLAELVIGADGHVFLSDLWDNGNRNGTFGVSEALYVDTLVFADASALLNLNGLNIYYNNLVGDSSQIIDQTVIPVPAAVWLFGSGLLGLVGMARRKKA